MDPVRSWVSRPLIADASMWINIVASQRASDLLRALGERPQIPRIALEELERGRAKGRKTAAQIAALIEGGLIAVVDLPEAAEAIYLSLVAGSVRQTLDDGEAATLATALALDGTAIIDERKALAIASQRFPDLPVISSSDLLLSVPARSTFTTAEIADMLFRSLSDARMRVPEHLLGLVADILGPERATNCISLPARLRNMDA